MLEKCDWTKHLRNIPEHNYGSAQLYTSVVTFCFDFFFSSCNHNIYILTATRLFKHSERLTLIVGKLISEQT